MDTNTQFVETRFLTLADNIKSGISTSLSAIILEGGVPVTVTIPNTRSESKTIKNLYKTWVKNGKDKETERELVKLVRPLKGLKLKTYEALKVDGILKGRMSRKGNRVLIDGETIDPTLKRHINRLATTLEAEPNNKDVAEQWRATVKFTEKLYANCTQYVRKQLLSWIEYENENGVGFTVNQKGNIIGYKGCAIGENGTAESINHGTAYVDGTRYEGAIPNPLGSTVTMPRNEVQDDPTVGCSRGLHVGTWEYASNWAKGRILAVEVNPLDVVSIPTECESQKLRCARYKIVDIIEVPYTEPVVETNNDYDDDDDYDDDYDIYDNYDENDYNDDDDDNDGWDEEGEWEENVVGVTITNQPKMLKIDPTQTGFQRFYNNQTA